MARIFKFLNFLLIFHHIICIDFHRKTTGVAFSPYVKHAENGIFPSWKFSYTMHEIRTMLELISTKFSLVSTFGVGADDVLYQKNSSYYGGSAVVMCAEAAARINKQKGEKNLTLLVGLWQSDSTQQMNTEVELALESSEKANFIWDGTVQGLLLTQNDIVRNLGRAEQTLEQLRYLKEAIKKRNLTLMLGSRQECSGLSEDKANESRLTLVRKEIVRESQFIICTIISNSEQFFSGVTAKDGFDFIKDSFLSQRDDLKRLNPSIEVIGETGWPSKGNKPWETLENLKEYWKIVDEWGSKNNFTMIMLEAFDNPWKDWSPNEQHWGWWRLKDNRFANYSTGYFEKVAENEWNTSMEAWTIIGITAILILTFALTISFFIHRNLQKDVAKASLEKELPRGLSDEGIALLAGGDYATASLKIGYDKSFEISRKMLTIYGELLGSGRFGIVYKGQFKQKGVDVIPVAVKTVRPGSPQTVLDGLVSEINIMSNLGSHPNILSIIGACTKSRFKGESVYLVTELCSLGSLKNYLVNGHMLDSDPNYAVDEALDGGFGEIIGKSDLLRWSHEIASGMEYLGVKRVLHADLATRNVLLAGDKTAKISDFGLSLKLHEFTNYVRKQEEIIPWRWMAIESLRKEEFSAKSDVWSFGVTMWEIFEQGCLPYSDISTHVGFADCLMEGLRLEMPRHASPKIYGVMASCWKEDHKERPSFTELKEGIEQLMTSHV